MQSKLVFPVVAAIALCSLLVVSPMKSEASTAKEIRSASVCVNRVNQKLVTTVVRTTRNYSKARINGIVAKSKSNDYSYWTTKVEYLKSMSSRIGDRGTITFKGYSKKYGTDYIRTYFRYVWC